jgi:hypothetical protein
MKTPATKSKELVVGQKVQQFRLTIYLQPMLDSDY